jgi:hypothetical protein
MQNVQGRTSRKCKGTKKEGAGGKSEGQKWFQRRASSFHDVAGINVDGTNDCNIIFAKSM